MDFGYFTGMTNPFATAFNQGMSTISNLGGIIGGAFNNVNRGNQEAQVANNQTNAALQMDANKEAAKTARVQQLLPLLQGLLGSGSASGSANSNRIRGFQATNFNQGGRING